MSDLSITVTLTNGSANFTVGTINGVGGGDLAAYGVKAGDLVLIQSRVACVATLTGALTGTLDQTWQGTTTALAAGKLRYQSEAGRLTGAIYTLVNALAASMLTGIGQLTGFAAGQLVRVTNGSGGTALADQKVVVGESINTATNEAAIAAADRFGFWDASASALRHATWTNLLAALGIETGTWTPVFAGATTAGTYSYSAQLGRYVRAGNLALFYFDLACNGVTSHGTGNMRIGGQPYALQSMVGGGLGTFVYSTQALPSNHAWWTFVVSSVIDVWSHKTTTGVPTQHAVNTVVQNGTRMSGIIVGQKV